MPLSWQARLLTPALRLIEKPQLARGKKPHRLRRNFELKSRLIFHAPRDVTRRTVTLGAGAGIRATPPQAHPTRRILYVHGGGYFFGSPRTHAAMLCALARRTGLTVDLARYPLAPEHPFPAGANAALAAWESLLAEGIAPQDIIIGGDSAGGGLALSLLGRLIADGRDLPGGVFCIAPWTDLTLSGDSLKTNARSEAVLPAQRFPEIIDAYLAGHDPRDPLASPLFADFTGAPPIWLCVDTTEVLLDDTLRLAERLRAAGVDVSLIQETGLPHVWPLFHNILPEARATLDHLAGWINSRWPSPDDN